MVSLLMRAHAYPNMPAKIDDPAPGPEIAMGALEFRNVIDGLFGARGKADAAREMSTPAETMSKSMVTRVLFNLEPLPVNVTDAQRQTHQKKSRAVPASAAERLRDAAIKRLPKIAATLTVPGMPDVEGEQTRGIRELIYRARELYPA